MSITRSNRLRVIVLRSRGALRSPGLATEFRFRRPGARIIVQSREGATHLATHVIGDVHGCYEELCDLLDALGPTGDDRLVFVGDLVVRGPDSASVVDLVLSGPLST